MMPTSNNKIHILLQQQADIGKKYISFLLKQYLAEKSDINYFYIQEKNTSFWDEIFNRFFTTKKAIFIISVNSSCFFYFKKYLEETNLLESIDESENNIFNHCVFSPGRKGEGAKETLDQIFCSIKKPGHTVVWENDNPGIKINGFTRGKDFRLKEFSEFKRIEKEVYAIISLPAESINFQKDLSVHINTGKTFDQAIYTAENNVIFRQRLYRIKKRSFEAIKNAGI
ncbi:MAG: hypothetical protein KKE61_11845 [Proteobacteria bacterium]|nr:hypothetical protein [Pseudomonadota bacterium]